MVGAGVILPLMLLLKKADASPFDPHPLPLFLGTLGHNLMIMMMIIMTLRLLPSCLLMQVFVFSMVGTLGWWTMIKAWLLRQ